MDACIFDVFGYGVGDYVSVVGNGVEFDLLAAGEELADHDRMLARHFGRHCEELAQVALVVAYVHRGAGQHVGRAHEHRIADLGDESVHVFHSRKLAPARLVYAQLVHYAGEFVAVLRPVDILCGRSEYRHVVPVESQSQVVRYLAAYGDNDTVRIFHFEYIHHPLESELVEVETVAHVVVGGYGLRVVVDEHSAIAALLHLLEAGYGTPIELHGAAYAVSARTEHHHGFAVVLVTDVVHASVVGQVEVVGLGREFGRKRVYLLDYRHDAQGFAVLAHPVLEHGGLFGRMLEDQSLYLMVGEALLLGEQEQSGRNVLERIVAGKVPFGFDYVPELGEEPAVYPGELVYAFHGVAGGHCLGYGEDALVIRLAQGQLYVVHLQLLVAYEAVGALAYHPEALLYGLLETAAYGHHLSHRLHRGAELAGHAVELAQVPARDLADHIVQGRLEEGRSGLGHGVVQVEEAVAQAELGGHEGQRIAGGLGCQGRGAAQAGVHLDYPVVERIRVEGVLHIALAHYAEMAYYLDGQFPEEVVVLVGEGLRRGHDYALARMYAERVEVLHIADGDAVVEAVAHHLVFYFLPALEGFLHQHLRGEGEGLFAYGFQFSLVLGETGAETAQGVGSPDNERIAQVAGGLLRLFHRLCREGAYGLDLYFVELLDEELAVLGVHDGLHRGAEHLHPIFLKYAVAVEFDAAVQRRLSAEGEEYALRPFLRYDFLHEEGSHRQEVYLVRNAFRGLYGGDVGIDQHGADALFPEGLEGLGAGIVELAGLAYLERARSEDQDFLYGSVSHS